MRRVYTTLALVLILFSLACSKSSSSAANMSADDKHKLYQAAINAHDTSLIVRVTEALGLSDANGKATATFGPFVSEHHEWASKNFDFVKEYLAPDKAKEYVNSHLPR